MANSRRSDPYKNFNFRNVFGAVALTGLAGALAAKLLRKLKSGKSPVDKTPTGARPIEAVGTSTAGLAGTTPKRAKRSPVRTRGPSKRRKAPSPRRRPTKTPPK